MVDAAARTVFYPSMVVNLQLRFDEGDSIPVAPKTTQELAEGPTAPPATTEQPLVLQQSNPSDSLSQVLGLVPKTCSVELPGYRQAGTFSMTIPYQDLPLDPRVVRAISVSIHLDAVPAADFAEGMTANPQGKRRSIIETNAENILLAATVDGINVEYSSDGTYVMLEGRDLSGILLDASMRAETLAKIDLTKPIDKVVEQIANLVSKGRRIPVDVDESEWPGGVVPSPGVRGDLTRVNLGAKGEGGKPTSKGEATTLKFWDAITQYCFLVGAVPHFVGSRIRVRRARSLFDEERQEKRFNPNIPTPFAGGAQRSVGKPAVEKPEQYAFRRLVFGSDLENLKFERKLGGTMVPVVEVVSVDTSSPERGLGRLLVAQHPDSGPARTTSVSPGGKAAQTDVLRVSVPGIRSKARLKQIAEDLYEEIGRQEIGGSAQTKSLSSFGGDNQDPDMVRLRPGDAIEFRVPASGLGVFPPLVSELTNQAERSFEEQVQAVAAKLGDDALARALVTSSRGETLQRTFRTANVRYDWDADSGISIAFDFQNFVEVRYAVTPQ